MTHISWEELIKNRKPVTSLHNSARMLEAIRKVKEKFPDAHTENYDRNASSFILMGGGKRLSSPHISHYACWLEAEEALHGADH